MADSRAAAQPQEIKTTGLSWVIAILVLLSYAVSFIARNVWSTAMPIAAPELGLNMAAAGGLMTAYYIGYVISNFVTGFAVDRYGPKLTLALATAFTGLFTILIPFSPNYWGIFILRVLAGASSGPLFACVTKYQISWFAPAVRTTALGLMMSGPAVGGAVATAAFAPIIRDSGWRLGFTYGGITCFIVAVLVFIICKEQGPAATRSAANKNASPEEKAAQKAGLRNVLLKKSFLIGTLTLLLATGANIGYTTYIIIYFTRVREFSLVTAGMIIGSTSMLGIITGIVSGGIADILKSKKLCIAIGAVLSVICTILIMVASNITMLIVVIGIRMFVGSLMGNPLNGLQAQAAAGPFAGRAMGFYNGIGQMGSILFPIIFGAILDGTGNNFSFIFIIIAITLGVCGFLCMFMEEKK